MTLQAQALLLLVVAAAVQQLLLPRKHPKQTMQRRVLLRRGQSLLQGLAWRARRELLLLVLVLVLVLLMRAACGMHQQHMCQTGAQRMLRGRGVGK
jgi:hypothetical protein